MKNLFIQDLQLRDRFYLFKTALYIRKRTCFDWFWLNCKICITSCIIYCKWLKKIIYINNRKIYVISTLLQNYKNKILDTVAKKTILKFWIMESKFDSLSHIVFYILSVSKNKDQCKWFNNKNICWIDTMWLMWPTQLSPPGTIIMWLVTHDFWYSV